MFLLLQKQMKISTHQMRHINHNIKDKPFSCLTDVFLFSWWVQRHFPYIGWTIKFIQFQLFFCVSLYLRVGICRCLSCALPKLEMEREWSRPQTRPPPRTESAESFRHLILNQKERPVKPVEEREHHKQVATNHTGKLIAVIMTDPFNLFCICFQPLFKKSYMNICFKW